MQSTELWNKNQLIRTTDKQYTTVHAAPLGTVHKHVLSETDFERFSLIITGYAFPPRGGGTPHSGQKGCLFKACSILKGRENRHFSKIRCKVKEMAAKAKCIQGCQFWQKQQRKTHSREPLSN